MGGIGSRIICTTIGRYYLTADDGSTVKTPMFYSAESNERVISPQDVCDSNKDFTIFTQQGDIETGEGYLLFQSTTGLQQALIPLEEHNQLWYIAHNSQASVINNKMHTMSSDAAHFRSGIALHDLWNNCLWYASNNSTKDVHKNCEGVPSLKLKNPLFQCSGCHSNITKKAREYSRFPKEENAEVNDSILILDL